MKKLLAVILSIVLLLPAIALADLPDLTVMSDQELKDLASLIADEFRSRNYSKDENGILLIDEGGIRIFKTGESYISKSGRLEIPVLIYNDLDVSANFSFKNTTVNDFAVQGYSYYSIPPHSKVIDELDFSSEDIGLNSTEDIFSLRFSWVIYSPDTNKYEYEHPEIEEHSFW